METSRSLVTLLARRAESGPGGRAYVFLSDRGEEEAVLTFHQLHDASHALAARLGEMAQPGDRAILVFPPGLEFLIAFFGCLIARVIAVPIMMPRRNSARGARKLIRGGNRYEARHSRSFGLRLSWWLPISPRANGPFITRP
jgi:acyl-CoA synthetase (AMP-forming)/AMP-acid ligase II